MNGKKKVIGFGSDGASIMKGSTNGVIQKLRDELNRPFILGIHCSAYRLELAFKDASKSISLYMKISQLMENFYLFYRNSSLNRSNLKIAFDSYNRGPLMPTRVNGTRWVHVCVPHTCRALKNMITGYVPIVSHLKQLQNPADGTIRKDQAAKARNFLKILTSKDCVFFLHHLWDVCNCLSSVSLAFQNRDCAVRDLHSELKAAMAVLESFKENDGPKLSEFLGEHEGMPDLTVDGHALNNALTGSFTSVRKKIIENIIESLSIRFVKDEELLKATSIANLSLWPKKLKDEPDYGNDAVQILLHQFTPALEEHHDVSVMVSEWIKLKTYMYSRFGSLEGLTWKRVNDVFGDKCPCILSLIDLILSLPTSSVEAERGFSLMKLIKTNWRSKLKDTTLSDLMVVKLESEPIISFDPNDSIAVWLQKKRMPNVNDKMNVNNETDLVILNESDEEVVEDEDILNNNAEGASNQNDKSKADYNEEDSENDYELDQDYSEDEMETRDYKYLKDRQRKMYSKFVNSLNLYSYADGFDHDDNHLNDDNFSDYNSE